MGVPQEDICQIWGHWDHSRSFGLTVFEAEILRSSDRLRIRILFNNPYLLIPKPSQTSKSDQNWRFLLVKLWWIFCFSLWRETALINRILILSRSETTSKFRPPVLWGRNFSSLADGRGWPQWSKLWHMTWGTLHLWLSGFMRIQIFEKKGPLYYLKHFVKSIRAHNEMVKRFFFACDHTDRSGPCDTDRSLLSKIG